MTTTTRQPRSETTGAPLPTGPMVRVVLASAATGVVGALFLTLVVFAGFGEHSITGAALLAFGAGWATLAALSARFTSQPQRWARVPAAVMAATGAGLVVLAPGEHALTVTGWFWPPAMLVLALWSLVQVRTSMTGRVRWAVYALLGGLALASVGGSVETVALAHDDDALSMPGQSYNIGGRSLHMTCAGTGSPTVVLVSGTAEMSASWARVMPRVAPNARVCAYDRAGQGWSDDAPHTQDGLEMAADLHQLLAVAGEPGPYVLTGHSLGGVYSLAFAARYPNDVAGIVLLDSSSPDQFALPAFSGQYEMIRRAYSVLPSVARLGVGRLVGSRVISTLPEPAAGQLRAFETSSRGFENARNEVARYRDAMRQARALSTLGDKPLVVLTAAGTLKDTAGWSRAQDKLAALSTNTQHTVADTTHAGILESRDGAAQSATAINKAVRAVQRHGSVHNE